MDVACYQVVSSAGTIRLWVGAHSTTSPPVLEDWRIDGNAVAAGSLNVVREMRSVRSDQLVDGTRPRAFSGVYEIAGVPAPRHHRVGVTIDGQRVERDARVLPDRIDLAGEPLTVLLVSCFDHSTDGRLYGQILPRIVRGAASPDLCLFMGDQVYLDLPTLMDFQDDPAWLAAKFEQDYVRNWFSGSFTDGLGLAPMVFVPDDHEYWNNFPLPSPFIQNSWSENAQGNWRRAARACYDGFQRVAAGDQTVRLDIAPLSFLFLDSRSDRTPDLGRLLSDDTHAALRAWTARVIDDPDMVAGVLLTGQSLAENPVGNVKGAVADYALANYEKPYRDLLGALTAISEAGKQVLLLTGDVHWGRVTAIRDRRRDAPAFYEVIASPASLVSTIGADQVSDVVGAVKKWFGAADAWPRHSDGQDPPAHLPYSDQRFRAEKDWRTHRGNQCAVLRMFRRGFGVTVEYQFHPLAGASRGLSPTSGSFQLTRTR